MRGGFGYRFSFPFHLFSIIFYETQSHFVGVGGGDAIVASIAAFTTLYNPMVGPCAVHINCGISLISFMKL